MRILSQIWLYAKINVLMIVHIDVTGIVKLVFDKVECYFQRKHNYKDQRAIERVKKLACHSHSLFLMIQVLP